MDSHFPPSDADRRRDAAVIETMVLLTTLSTAAEVRHAVSERRAGRDPSAQEEDAIVRPLLRETTAHLDEMLMRLRLSLIYAGGYAENDLSASVRRFDDLLILVRVGRLLQVLHQRLLSLYPAVSEELVEEARITRAHLEGLGERDDLAACLSPFLDRAFRLTSWIRREL
jgi:hypothetical protein